MQQYAFNILALCYVCLWFCSACRHFIIFVYASTVLKSLIHVRPPLKKNNFNIAHICFKENVLVIPKSWSKTRLQEQLEIPPPSYMPAPNSSLHATSVHADILISSFKLTVTITFELERPNVNQLMLVSKWMLVAGVEACDDDEVLAITYLKCIIIILILHCIFNLFIVKAHAPLSHLQYTAEYSQHSAITSPIYP